MEKRVYVRVNNGIEELVRITGMLKRKMFDVKSINMDRVDEKFSDLTITLNEKIDRGAKQAMGYINKLSGIREIKEVNI